MNKLIILAAAISATLLTATASRADTVPCEDALGQLRALEATAKPNAADKAQAEALKAKGIERCNADDDKRADEFFAQATQLLSK